MSDVNPERHQTLEFILSALQEAVEKEDAAEKEKARLKELGDKKYKLIIVGKGNSNKYKRLTEDLSLREQIIFAGPLLDTPSIYAASDVFLLPTLYDPFSNACLEAIATGIPLLTTKMNGASEIIVEGKNGFLIDDPRNAGVIAEKINLSIQLDKEELDRINRDILERFSKQKDIKETISLYEEVIHEPSH